MVRILYVCTKKTDQLKNNVSLRVYLRILGDDLSPLILTLTGQLPRTPHLLQSLAFFMNI